jgi:hypothetical protein
LPETEPARLGYSKNISDKANETADKNNIGIIIMPDDDEDPVALENATDINMNDIPNVYNSITEGLVLMDHDDEDNDLVE